jgi:predicted metal-dependent phosphoesterase TrpH
MSIFGTLIDMHMHTVRGAYDSGLQPEVLADEARRVGLTAVNITEHDRVWDSHSLAQFRDEQAPLFVNNGMEVSTELGHILAVGLPGYVSGIHKAAELRKAADETGAFLIAAHPFRHWFDPIYFTRQGKKAPEMTPEALAKSPIFQYVDALEVLNGYNSPEENLMALKVANLLGKPGTGGSDCHSAQGIGCYCTCFERTVETPELLLAELHAGRFVAGRDLPAGELAVFTEAWAAAQVQE